jgi:deoxyribodipyrimidine photo-lyase
MYKKSLFIFRRDLRIEDNTGLNAAIEQSASVIPCFIFDPRQVGDKNSYRSMNAIQFMVESLKDLEVAIKKHGGKLFLFSGNAEDIISTLIKKEGIEAVFVNEDYTPFSIKRDKKIAAECAENKIDFHSSSDLLLTSPQEIKNGSGKPYSIFTAFFKNASKLPVRNPISKRNFKFYAGTIPASESDTIYKKVCPTENKNIFVHGGRTKAGALLYQLPKLKNYQKTRDYPAMNTSHLAAHFKFGTISIREGYAAIEKALGAHNPLLKQFYWRDFFTHVAFHFPFVFGKPFHNKYEKLWWSDDRSLFNKWCKGQTGFPIVDAGMRELNATGFMHNRVRMIVASFLTKDLHIDWLWGEKYFAQHLVDYDPAVNNGNWQWSASTGCDAQPYFRIFNPWLQQKKFDPACDYIKKWIPELKDVPPKDIHAWQKQYHTYDGYFPPMVDHALESRKAKALYKKR